MIPVFGPVPGGMEIGVIVLLLTIILAPAYHVYRDAKARGGGYVYPQTMGMLLVASSTI
ncbi:hypothetical protein GCM10025751_03500 [Haladaptatus pallidirubidus]|uniref:Uncharacterized protein n=1 Tax=Haladaptatus pallidirubidus TaxID=1008152 RepID=A0AAV3UCN9_9EURY